MSDLRAGPTTSMAFQIPLRVLNAELVAALAVRQFGVPSSKAVAAKNILTPRDAFKVKRMYAGALSAQVVEFKTDWNLPDQILVGPSVCLFHPALRRPESSVAPNIDVGVPQPTRTEIRLMGRDDAMFDFFQEPVGLQTPRAAALSRPVLSTLSRTKALPLPLGDRLLSERCEHDAALLARSSNLLNSHAVCSSLAVGLVRSVAGASTPLRSVYFSTLYAVIVLIVILIAVSYLGYGPGSWDAPRLRR